ncbi:MAG TPA: sugar transferase [Acidimicrobiales bacterium]|nr:sugar transferase [Acidimicrobiales bacterium]
MTVAASRPVGTGPPPPERVDRGIVAPAWSRTVPAVVAAADLVAGAVAAVAGLHLHFGEDVPPLRLAGGSVGPVAAALALAAAWPGVLGALGAYRSVVVGSGGDELARVVEAGLVLFAAVGSCHLLLGTSLSGRVVALLVGLLVAAASAVRLVADGAVRRARRHGRWQHRAVVYGSAGETAALARQLGHRPPTGVEVVGACATDRPGAPGEAALDAMSRARADLLAVAGGTSPAEVRALAWALEGTGAELLIAPAVPDLAQQRVVVQPVGGAVLLRVEKCAQRRGRLLVKNLIDRVGSALLLLLLAPVVAAVAVAVRASGPGPLLFRQVRVGQRGASFDFLKFRTMTADAELHRGVLDGENDADGLLFKLHDDPRVTPVGRFLRRASLDELPQLWNVLRGDMSLVGPRPLPVDSNAFVGDERRRLRVKPGVTGLWQVSGRSDLGWAETVALDMHYVDHWSLGMDLAIMARTPLAVLRGRGAY